MEEGITKTKKKHKWKRKKKTGINEAEKDAEIKGDSKPVNGDVNKVEGSTKKKKKKKKKKNDEETTVNGDVKYNSAKVENGSASNKINENDVNNPTKKKKKKKKNGDNKIDTDSNLTNGAS